MCGQCRDKITLKGVQLVGQMIAPVPRDERGTHIVEKEQICNDRGLNALSWTSTNTVQA